MAVSITVTELILRARQQANMENSSFVADEEVTHLIDRAYRELYDLVVQSYENYFVSSYSFNLVSGTDTYSLPTDFYKSLGVDYDTGDNTQTLRPFMFTERNKARASASRAMGSSLQYLLQGGSIKFLPVPSTTTTITLWYVPEPGLLSTGAQTIDTVNGWDDYIILAVAEKLLAKEESDTSAVVQMKADARTRVLQACANRDPGEPERMTDVEYSQNAFPWQFRQ